jgi:uncharacterized protein involved in response to NO
MKLSEYPVWLVGFRPFFILACVAGMVLPLAWAMMFSGQLAPPSTPFSMIQWHAHEMLFGFGWAVLGGFLLTSTKNWVKIRGYHGRVLIVLTLFWLLERIGMSFAAAIGPLAFSISNNLFLVSMIALLLWTLLRHRANDTFRAENWAFLVMLPSFLVAKQLLLSDGYFAYGSSMAIGLFRLAFLVMLERTLTQFMKNALQVEILRNVWLDRAIKLLTLVYVMESFLPRPLATSIALVLAALLLFRLAFWKPLLALRRLDLGIMILGYASIVAQLLIEVVNVLTAKAWVGSVAVHVFTFGAMGLIIPAMLTRICNGHTGRKVAFGALDKAVLWIMMSAFVVRIVLPQYWPSQYLLWIELSAIDWFSGFALLAWRYVPYLLAARVDGKEH